MLNSAIYWLNQWVTKGTPPPSGQRLTIESTSPFAYAKDTNGNTLGGVRSPQVDAPIATLAGIGNTPADGHTDNISRFCVLFGSTVPYTPTQLSALYKNHGQFVSAWSNDIQKLVDEGFLLQPDGVELLNAAAMSHIGK